jgi:hypothetical protein
LPQISTALLAAPGPVRRRCDHSTGQFLTAALTNHSSARRAARWEFAGQSATTVNKIKANALAT